MTPTLQIIHLVDPAVLQHVQDSFALQKSLSILTFDTRGEKLTRPSSNCPLPAEMNPILGPFLDFILTNPPHFADLGLRDGNTVFASFFNGIFHRAILPVMVQRQALGRDAEVTARVVRRVGHQPQVRQCIAGLKTLHGGRVEAEIRRIHIARHQPEHILPTRLQQGQRPRDTAGRLQRTAKVGLLVGV